MNKKDENKFVRLIKKNAMDYQKRCENAKNNL